jgi:hypothetical protein
MPASARRPYSSYSLLQLYEGLLCGQPHELRWLNLYSADAHDCMRTIYQRHHECDQTVFNHATSGDGNCVCLLTATANATTPNHDDCAAHALSHRGGMHVYRIVVAPEDAHEHPGVDGSPLRLRLSDASPQHSAAVMRVHGAVDITGELAVFVNQVCIDLT